MNNPRHTLLLAAAVGALLAVPAAAQAAPVDRTGDAAAPTARTAGEPQGIVGGSKAREGAYPWIVRLEVQYRSQVAYLCGGTLISQDIVLTSQQCLAEVPKQGKPTRITAYIGKVDHKDAAEDRAVRQGAEYSLGKGVGNGDWAVVQLDKPFKARSYPLLPLDEGYDETEEVRALGWGRTELDAQLPSALRQVDLPIVTGRACARNADVEICAGDPRAADVGVCAGDQGGPLLAAEDAAGRAADWVQVGITSQVDCAQKNQVGHFTRVSAFTRKIQAAIVLIDGSPAQTIDTEG
ncbi:hypothetical protein GCM10010124_34420 [Pilimelia terevasa]|uniref:Peptidase S1 domain-containing protein n=1 Tax=Pilimelia terevasa TaxID=53372 RepID=A0A8J3BUR3_9ACTN|nr:serine protease [Pilimelia terevasa]GGK38721.1 hypothetical protein GCM10010124_34420 [Pilimelia terevasa]